MGNDDKARRFVMYMIRITFVKHPYDVNGRRLAIKAKGIFIDEVSIGQSLKLYLIHVTAF